MAANDNDSVVKLAGTESDKLAAALEQLTRNMLFYEEYTKKVARIRKMSYDAHILSGFTPEQAVILCQSVYLT